VDVTCVCSLKKQSTCPLQGFYAAKRFQDVTELSLVRPG
jgi:hypothetical protein